VSVLSLSDLRAEMLCSGGAQLRARVGCPPGEHAVAGSCWGVSETRSPGFSFFPFHPTSFHAGTFADRFNFRSRRNKKAIYIAAVETTVKPLEIPLTNGGQAFWLAPRVIAHVVPNEETKVQDVYAISVEFETQSVDGGPMKLATPDPPVLIGSFPTSTSNNFRYAPESGVLVFSDYVYEDGELKAVKEGDKAWEGRGNTALVYDETYVRHWDTYRGPKHLSLFSVKLAQTSGVWSLGEEFINLLAGTTHVSSTFLEFVVFDGLRRLPRALLSSRLEGRTISTFPRRTLCTPHWTLCCLPRGTPNKT
jgi:hypothetical protein